MPAEGRAKFRPAHVPKQKQPGGLVNAVLLVDHGRDCPRRDVGWPWLIQFWPAMFDAERLEYRDSIGRHREPLRGGQAWVIFPCTSANCTARVSLRLAGIERMAAEMAREALK